jgi:serine/threonine-protein kinase
VDTGHLVYEDGAALWAARFDLNALSVVGDAKPVLEQVTTREAAANFSVSRQGTLVYAPSTVAFRSLVWIDRKGNELQVGAPQHFYQLPRLSPDGTRVALHISDGRGIPFWIWDFSQRRLSAMRSGSEGLGGFSVWSPDSRYLFVGARNLFRHAADGTGEERLTSDANPTGAGQRRPVEVSPDGTRLIYEQYIARSSYDLMQLPLQGQGKGGNPAEPLLNTPADERNASIAPNGRWMAYESNKTGQFQIYVKPFPNVNDAEYQVSTAGGRTPLFARNGRELFFVSGSALMTAPVRFAPTFSTGNPTVLIDAPSIILDGRRLGNTGRTYEASRDGDRFLLLKDDADRSTNRPGIVVVQNWFRELNEKLPVVR